MHEPAAPLLPCSDSLIWHPIPKVGLFNLQAWHFFCNAARASSTPVTVLNALRVVAVGGSAARLWKQ